MTTENRPAGIHPTDTFPIVWRVNNNGLVHNVAEVPMEEPIHLHYSKAKSGTSFRLIPTDDTLFWTVEGRVDTNILRRLNLISSRIVDKQYKDLDVLSAEEKERIADSGKIEHVTSDQYDASLWVSATHIRDLLTQVWVPNIKSEQPPKLVLGRDDVTHRLLPQKISKSRYYNGGILQIVRNEPLKT